MSIRTKIAALSVSGCLLVTIAGYEGYSGSAYTPIKGDKLTIGFGTTEGVKQGDTIKPTEALRRMYTDTEKIKAKIGTCVKVPLKQTELDAYMSFAYNVGTAKFCNSTMVKKLNAGDYAGACAQLKRWVYFRGKKNQGLITRRESEYQTCIKP